MDQQPALDRRDAGGDLITALIDEVFQLNGRLLRAGDALAAEFGLTGARWQVLGAIGDGPATAAQIARRRGLRRQSVQELVTRLRADGLVEVRPNPGDRRAPLVALTPRAERLLTAIGPAQARWSNHLGSTLTAEQLANAVQVLAAVRAMIDD
ncbi:MarR family winged helix-turn-helix transcriptional regulator [Actinoallomurus vinaceus]|uniref:MarR family winged helix-turn-helix transcriptional regulator n=1 Tax=Actinoallomurus vinaceus TaxID=1080074 RepID=A0ABP8UI87_9ACTN